MIHTFDQDYWDRHWDSEAVHRAADSPNPHLVRETGGLAPGTALDAGCGAGAEVVWLASRGWHVTGVDISRRALSLAAHRAATGGVGDKVQWVQADLSEWAPATTYDLVTTHYAHPAMSQLGFYERLAGWVAPGGTLLIIGHLHHSRQPGHHASGAPCADGPQPPTSASSTAADVTTLLDPTSWMVVTAEESQRTISGGRGGGPVTLDDVVVRAIRRR